MSSLGWIVIVIGGGLFAHWLIWAIRKDEVQYSAWTREATVLFQCSMCRKSEVLQHGTSESPEVKVSHGICVACWPEVQRQIDEFKARRIKC